jgi:hypothetical protein
MLLIKDKPRVSIRRDALSLEDSGRYAVFAVPKPSSPSALSPCRGILKCRSHSSRFFLAVIVPVVPVSSVAEEHESS